MLTQKYLRSILDYDPETGILTRKVDSGNSKAGDACGYLKKTGYIHLSVNNKNHLIHRIIFVMWFGYTPKCVDHIDGNKSNNKINNLRECTVSQNAFNSARLKRNTSGVKGVCWHKRDRRWRAVITVMGKVICVGSFIDIKQAEEAIVKKREELHGEFANHG